MNKSIFPKQESKPLSISANAFALVSCATHLGHKRTNQDSYVAVEEGRKPVYSLCSKIKQNTFVCEKHQLMAAVCDGVSVSYHPHNPEKDASSLVCKAITAFDFFPLSDEKAMSDAMETLNQAVCEEAETHHDTMATTLSFLMIENDLARVVYIGDSPAVVIKNNGILHNIGGPLSKGEPLAYYLGNANLKANKMYSSMLVTVDPGEVFILGTDGALNNFLGDDEGMNALAQIAHSNIDSIASEIINEAARREKRKPFFQRYHDNRTVIAIKIL